MRWARAWWLAGSVATLLTAHPGTQAQELRPSTPPPVLNAELFYQLLVGEFQVSVGEPGAGYSLMLDAARKTQNPGLYKRAVEIALQGRAGESALSAARAWSQAWPQDIEPRRYMLQILVALNRPAELVEPVRALVQLTPLSEREALIAAIPQTLARTSDKNAALQSARLALQDAIRTPKTAASAWAAIGRMQLANSQSSEALESARKGLAAEASSIYPALLALELMETEQADAEALLQAHLDAADERSGPTIRLEYARTLMAAQRFKEAGRQIQRITAQHPNTSEAWLLQGTLLAQENRLDEAKASLLTYLDRNPVAAGSQAQRGHVQAFLQLARIAEKQGDFDSANAWLDRIDDPQILIDVHWRRASVLARQGHMEQARELLRQSPERSPDDARRKLQAEAQLLREFGQYEAALQVYAEAIRHFPDDADLIYEQAMTAEKAGQAALMERLLRQLIANFPDYHHAYNALGYWMADRGLYLDEAKALIQKALQFTPGDPYIQDSLGWVEFRLGNLEQAERILRSAYQKRPDAEIAAHLGEVLWALNHRQDALRIWREGLLLNPDNETLKETLKRLRAQP